MGQNLVPNSSFESFSSAPTTYGQMNNATGWYSAYGSADLFHTSAGSGSVGIPANYFGNQAARTGNAYAGIASSQTNSYHEYMGIALTTPLTVGQLYYCEAYVSAGEGSYRLGINNFGFRFTSGVVMGGAGDPPISAVPQVNWTASILDYTNWVRVSGTFTATAANTHLTLGNFYSVAATTWTPLGTAGAINSQYWFIEDVLVQPSVPFAMGEHTFTARPISSNYVGLDWEFTETTGFKEFTVERSVDDGATWVEFARIPASENVSAYSHTDRPNVWGKEIQYVLRQVNQDGSVSISETKRVTLDVPTLEQSLALSPNPVQAGDPCDVILAAEGVAAVQWALFDIAGKMIQSGEAAAASGQTGFTVETAELKRGVYLLKVIAGDEAATRKLMVR